MFFTENTKNVNVRSLILYIKRENASKKGRKWIIATFLFMIEVPSNVHQWQKSKDFFFMTWKPNDQLIVIRRRRANKE